MLSSESGSRFVIWLECPVLSLTQLFTDTSIRYWHKMWSWRLQFDHCRDSDQPSVKLCPAAWDVIKTKLLKLQDNWKQNSKASFSLVLSNLIWYDWCKIDYLLSTTADAEKHNSMLTVISCTIVRTIKKKILFIYHHFNTVVDISLHKMYHCKTWW